MYVSIYTRIMLSHYRTIHSNIFLCKHNRGQKVSYSADLPIKQTTLEHKHILSLCVRSGALRSNRWSSSLFFSYVFFLRCQSYRIIDGSASFRAFYCLMMQQLIMVIYRPVFTHTFCFPFWNQREQKRNATDERKIKKKETTMNTDRAKERVHCTGLGFGSFFGQHWFRSIRIYSMRDVHFQ